MDDLPAGATRAINGGGLRPVSFAICLWEVSSVSTLYGAAVTRMVDGIALALWSGLTETCLTCLHTCHLQCLQEWRAQDGGNACPASCGCECATLGTIEAPKTEDDGLSDAFKSPLLVV